jgi:hypothetical protein
MINIGDCRLLVSCCNQNGGLYLLTCKKNKFELMKILDVECRGIAKHGDNFLVISNTDGIFMLDNDFNIHKQKSFSKELDFHGVAIKNDKAFIVETRTNSIGVYSLHDDIRKIDELKFSHNKYRDVCHLNDLFFHGERLFVSMFSYPYRTTLNGVILEYSLTDRKIKKIIHDKLSQPHSVLFYNDNLYYCDSARFQVKQDEKVIFNSLGYTRGLAIHNQTMFIGQSESRHLEQLLKDHTNILLDCGIYIHDLSGKLSSFIHIPSPEIYSLLII